MATADKLQKLLETKDAIRQAIVSKGVEISDDTVFADYPAKISAIQGEGGGSGGTDWLAIRTNNGENCEYLFYRCNAESLDISSLDTSYCTNMQYMFYYCYYLKSLDLSNFNTSNCTNMSNMFFNCNELTSLDLSNFNTSKVTKMGYLFRNCSNIESLDGIENFNVSKVTDMDYMFMNCKKLKSLDLNSWILSSSLTSLNEVFRNCESLESLDVSTWDTSNILNINRLFNGCKNLTDLDLSSWDVSKVTTTYYSVNVFDNCTSLINFQAPKNISVPLNFSTSPNLTHDSLMSIINNLKTGLAGTPILTLGATNLAKLSDEEKAIATSKGWTLA